MAFEPINLASSKRAAPPASPVRTLLYISSQGVVFKSAATFDSGTRLAIGLHLHKIRGDLGLSEDDDGLYGDRFLQLQGLVADCKLVEVSPLGRFYQVTLIFDTLTEADHVLLTAVERSRRAAQATPGPQGAQGAQNTPRAAAIPGAGGLN